MDNSSFRDILARFLEENSTHEASEKKTFQPEPTPLLQWEKPSNLKQTPRDFRSTGYPAPRPQMKTVPPPQAKPARAPVEEKLFKLTDFSPLDQDAIRTLLHIGAVELNGPISSQRLKKAHRRLAKALHPDRIDAKLSMREKDQRREQFLMLQAAYETVSKALSAKASGSESASGPGSQHQDAA